MAETIAVDWSKLPQVPLTTIAKCLDTSIDTLRLRSVCAAWRSSIAPFQIIPPLPMVLPFPIAPNPALNRKRRGHYSLKWSTIYFVQPPPDETPRPKASKSETPKGWLLRVEESGDGKMRPLNVLSRILTEKVPEKFPKVLNLLNFRVSEIGKVYSMDFVDLTTNIERDFNELKSMLFKKVVISSTPWTANGDHYAVMAIHGTKLGFIELGSTWSAIDDSKQSYYDDIVYFKGQFCAVDSKGRAVVISTDLKAKEIAMPLYGGGQFKRLVVSGSDLYLIDRYIDSADYIYFDETFGPCPVAEIDPDAPVHLQIYKLNEEDKEWEWVESLGDDVFFIGDDCSFAVSALGFAGLKGNCVYFSEDMLYGSNETDTNLGELCIDTSLYCLESTRCGPIASFPDHSQIFWTSPAWLKPNPLASKK